MAGSQCLDHSAVVKDLAEVSTRVQYAEKMLETQARLLESGRKTFARLERRMMWLIFAVILFGFISVGSTLAANGNMAAVLRLFAGAAMP